MRAVGRGERHVAHRLHVAEALGEASRASIIAALPSGSTKSGRGMRSRQLPSRPAALAVADERLDQARRAAVQAHAVARAWGATKWRACGSVAATCSPWRGGVAGSMPPERISAGTSERHRVVEVRRARCRAARAARAR